MKTSLSQVVVRGVLAFLLFGFGGCGGGGGANYAGGGIGGSGIAVGTITAFGSIFVNEVEFDTHGASVSTGGVDRGVGDQVARDYLRVGQVVVVEGIVDDNAVTGTASQVSFEADVAGQIDRIDRATREISILDQTVAIDEETLLFDERNGDPRIITLDEVSEGDWVEVSGLANGDGKIQATCVGWKLSLTALEVKGVVRNLNTSDRTFRIRRLMVSYATADTTALPQDDWEGLLVRVIGALGPGGELAATKIQLAREARVTSSEVMSVNGLVTELVSQSVLSSEFSVGYQRVRTDKETKFQRGDWKDIELGVRLEVRGKLENGILAARKVIFAKK